MEKINERKDLAVRKNRPLKVAQFGEGNFLRAFCDYVIDVANEEGRFDGNIAIIMPRPLNPRSRQTIETFKAQDCFYTVCLRGKRNGKTYTENRVITSVEKIMNAYEDYEEFMALAEVPSLEYVLSNTTEAGIVFDANDKFEDKPAMSFPAKLTQFLNRRFEKGGKGLTLLPAELIDHNGAELKKCVLQYIDLWKLSGDFKNWIEKECIFADTLVDRIVPGFPKGKEEAYAKELGYEDKLLDEGEPFGLWVIGDTKLEKTFSIGSEKLQVKFTDELPAFKEQKVRILNGAHTSMVLGAYLAGFDYVGDCMADPVVRRQLEQSVFGEIVPTVHVSKAQAEEFAKAVFERFENPFVKHALLSISLNSISKWRARVLPSLKDSLKNTGKLPKWLTYSLAALLAFYRTEKKGDNCLIGTRGNSTYEIHDDTDKMDFVAKVAGKSTADYAKEIMSQADWWGEDLTKIKGLYDKVVENLNAMEKNGVKAHIEALGK